MMEACRFLSSRFRLYFHRIFLAIKSYMRYTGWKRRFAETVYIPVSPREESTLPDNPSCLNISKDSPERKEVVAVIFNILYLQVDLHNTYQFEHNNRRMSIGNTIHFLGPLVHNWNSSPFGSQWQQVQDKLLQSKLKLPRLC